ALGERAEDLIVGPVFFDDVEDVLDRAGIAYSGGNRRLLRRRRVAQELVGIRAVAVHRGRVGIQFLFVGNRHNRQGAGQRRADVGERTPLAGFGFFVLLLVEWIRPGLIAFADAYKERLAVRRDGYRRRIPASWNKALHLTLVRYRDIN